VALGIAVQREKPCNNKMWLLKQQNQACSHSFTCLDKTAFPTSEIGTDRFITVFDAIYSKKDR
jgi:hypothetical protein